MDNETITGLTYRPLSIKQDPIKDVRDSFSLMMSKQNSESCSPSHLHMLNMQLLLGPVFREAGYPHMTLLWRNIFYAWDPYSRVGFGHRLDQVDKYWIHRCGNFVRHPKALQRSESYFLLSYLD